MKVITEEDFNKERQQYFQKKSKEDEKIIPRDKIPNSVTEYMLEQTAKVCFEEKLLKSEYEIQDQFVSNLSQKIGEEDFLFKTEPFNCGSAYEGVKINAPDEFDHIFEIQGTELISSTIEFEEFELPISKPTKYKDIKHRSYFQLKVKHLQRKDETLDNFLFRCRKCLNKDFCDHWYKKHHHAVHDFPSEQSVECDCLHEDRYLCPKLVLGEFYSKIIHRHRYGREPSLIMRCKDCLFQDRCSHLDKYLSPADQLKILYQSASKVRTSFETYGKCLEGYRSHSINHIPSFKRPRAYSHETITKAIIQKNDIDPSLHDKLKKCINEIISEQKSLSLQNTPTKPEPSYSWFCNHECFHMREVRQWAQQQHSLIYKHRLQSSVEYRWEPYLRCKECLGRSKCRYRCNPKYLCPRAVQNNFCKLIQDSVKEKTDESMKYSDETTPYISRNGPAITIYRESESGKHLASTDLVPGIPIKNTNNRQWPLAGVLPIDLNEYITEYMEAHGKKTIEKCHFIPYGDFWKLTFVHCERDVTERIMRDPFRKLSYLALKSMRGVTSEATPFENSILPSYILKVPFLREVLTEDSSGNHEPTEDVKRDLDLLFNGKCPPGSAAFHRILSLKETENSMRKAFEVVERVEREGTAGCLTGLFIKNNLLRQPDDKAFQVVRRIKHHLQDFAKQTCSVSELFLMLFCFVFLMCGVVNVVLAHICVDYVEITHNTAVMLVTVCTLLISLYIFLVYSVDKNCVPKHIYCDPAHSVLLRRVHSGIQAFIMHITYMVFDFTLKISVYFINRVVKFVQENPKLRLTCEYFIVGTTYPIVEFFKAVFTIFELGMQFLMWLFENVDWVVSIIIKNKGTFIRFGGILSVIAHVVKQIMIMIKNTLLLFCEVIWNFTNDLYGH